MPDSSVDNKRIAKNTLFLYLRTILTMLVSLYTSRVVLDVLGVEDYGVYQVVGGVVAMFSVISGALSTAISRFLTFGLGKGDNSYLRTLFSTSIVVQFIIAGVVLILCEIVGVWFLNYKLSIPEGRTLAANWVLHCSLIAFLINLISVPYNASIISHEKMDVFAYVSILEVVLKLLIVYALLISPIDKLITYSILTVCVSVCIRIIYGIYCTKHFIECRGKFTFDNKVLREILGFSGWNFISNAVYVFNTQGINMLINVYFGVVMNAARGIASQVESSVLQFVNNFSVSINPQITKSYASGDYSRMTFLVIKGAKFTFYLFFIFALPVLMETEFLLGLWLKTVPDNAVLFTRLGLIATLIGSIGNSAYTACLATGNIKKYTICTTSLTCMVFFSTWVAYRMGLPVQWAYIINIVVYIILQFVRLWIMKGLMNFDVMRYILEVFGKIIIVVIPSVAIPFVIRNLFDNPLAEFLIVCATCVIISSASIYFIGLSKSERITVNEFVLKRLKK